MAATAALLLLLAGPGLAGTSRNATADVLAEQGLVLGIDFDWENPKAPHPTEARRKAYAAAGLAPWVESQTRSATDEIAEPPAALRSYLEQNRSAVWSVIAALEKDPPDWGSADKLPRPELLPNIRLQRLLLAVALLEELDGDGIAAARALEASWSLGEPVARDETVMAQLMRIHDARWQSGALRKSRSASLVWMGRLGRDDLWAGMIAGTRGEGEIRSEIEAGPSPNPMSEIFRKSARAIADGLRKVSPCDREALTDEALAKLAGHELGTTSDPAIRSARELYVSNFLPNIAGMIRRGARAAVDRELTLRIMELRLEREASRDGKWPLAMANPASAACAEAAYAYRSDGDSMEIRFEGPAVVPDGLSLPLEFRSGPPPRAPSPSARPPLTPASPGGMIPGP